MTAAALTLGAPATVLDAFMPPPSEPARPRRAPDPAHDALENRTLCTLVERIGAGDQKALEALYDATASRIFAMARGITRNRQCAEEVTEDVYWQVWRQALRFDRQRGPVMAWMSTLARSRALDHLRHARNDGQTISHPEPHTLLDDTGPADDDPAHLLDCAEQDRSLTAALEALAPQQRQLLALAIYRGLTHEDIASQTGLPLGTVKSHIRRAIGVLRNRLARDAEGTPS